MSKANDFLVEIGTEELPPKALRTLMDAFASGVAAGLDDARLAHGEITPYASPRRLAVLVNALVGDQEDRRSEQKGPPVSVAIDDDGELTAAGQAFAKKWGVKPEDLERTKTEKGEWLSCTVLESGQAAKDLLPNIVAKALADLPIPRRMRWGDRDTEFVRPVHWVVMLHGEQIVKATILGVKSGNKTRGHRFMSSGTLVIESPAKYASTLEKSGKVIASFDKRRDKVVKAAEAAATKAGGVIVDGEALYDEVAALVEWPVPVTGSFDEKYLELPREVVSSTLTSHQRYFPVADASGELMARFVTLSNLKSSAPAKVRDGNERVIRPRLADAAFFWDNDRRTALSARQAKLREVVYQRGLGSLHDKSARVGTIARWIADTLAIESATLERAAALSKCDLITDMVGEFPDLQGTMGGYYARHDGEADSVATAIAEHYLPRFSGDALPETNDGQVLALADRIDTLAGVFVIGKKPSGNRDPFGLRRAAVAVVRLLVECKLDLDLAALIDAAVSAQPGAASNEFGEELYAFISERLRRYFLDRDSTLATETFDAVLARRPSSLVDFERRLDALKAFIKLDEAASLASANKRIANILKKESSDSDVNPGLLADAAEVALADALSAARDTAGPLLAARDYGAVLTQLAGLREPIDRFFDDVMVMADDVAVRNNRLALLRDVRALFNGVADISRLALD
ncbi:MAG: glycine--tRNA ligase subunit beta [Pseudomonadota bacterium]